jgi:hypothetical protein
VEYEASASSSTAVVSVVPGYRAASYRGTAHGATVGQDVVGASLAAALAGGMVGSIGIEAAKVNASLGGRPLAAWRPWGRH